MKKLAARSRHSRRSSPGYIRGFNTKFFPVIITGLLLVAGITIVKNSASNLSSSPGSVLSKSDSGSGSSGSGSSGSGRSDSGSSGDDSSGSSDSGSGSSDSGSSGSGSSGSGDSGSRSPSPQPTNNLRFSLTPVPSSTPTPVRIDEDTRNETTGDRTRVQVQEGQTRLEQEIFEGGVRKRIEMRNENGRIRVRVKTKDALGNETDQRLDLRPEEGLVRLRVTEGGIEKDVKVRVQNDRFVISQEGFGLAPPGGELAATTNFPLTLDKETNTIAVETPLGRVNVQQLPSTAIEQVLAANVLDVVQSTELSESEADQDQVVYRLKGVKNTRFLGLISVDAPILAEVSAVTGEQVFVQEPWYLNAFGFLFTPRG